MGRFSLCSNCLAFLQVELSTTSKAPIWKTVCDTVLHGSVRPIRVLFGTVLVLSSETGVFSTKYLVGAHSLFLHGLGHKSWQLFYFVDICERITNVYVSCGMSTGIVCVCRTTDGSVIAGICHIFPPDWYRRKKKIVAMTFAQTYIQTCISCERCLREMFGGL